MAETQPTPIADVLVDLARVATGFAVLGVQQAQVWRRRVEKDLAPVVGPLVEALRDGLRGPGQERATDR